MNDIFQIANVGMIDSKQRLEAISENAASASLPGFRRHVITGRTFDASLAASDVNSVTLDASTSAGRLVPQQVILQRGAMIATGRALDVAIDGDDNAFFALTDGTQTWLTRAGAFRLNADGVLVGEHDLRVVGASGDVRLPGTDVAVEADGRITHEGVVVATLPLFRPANAAAMLAARGTLLEVQDGVQPAEPDVRVRGGTLEASNTDATKEMLNLMSLSRQFESLSRIVQSYDEVLGRAIQKLGEG